MESGWTCLRTEGCHPDIGWLCGCPKFQDAWTHYTKNQNLKSIGVLAVTVAECEQQDLSVLVDPAPFPEHALINFGDLSRRAIANKAKELLRLATIRDWQYRN